MPNLKEYGQVKMHHIEKAIRNTFEKDADYPHNYASDLIKMCRDEYERCIDEYQPFWHTAKVLEVKGHHDIVSQCIRLSNRPDDRMPSYKELSLKKDATTAEKKAKNLGWYLTFETKLSKTHKWFCFESVETRNDERAVRGLTAKNLKEAVKELTPPKW